MNPPTGAHANGSDGTTSPPPLPSAPSVYGCVIGVQRGRTVEIFNSFELLYDPSTHSLDRTFLEKKQELCSVSILSLSLSLSLFTITITISIRFIQLLILFYDHGTDKKVFPNFYILGWYSTGSDAQESDMHIHKAVSFLSFLNAFMLSTCT
jgi:COP9 signalosome complex subunit 6